MKMGRLFRSVPISIIEIAVPQDMWHEREAGLAGALPGWMEAVRAIRQTIIDGVL